MAHLPKKNQVVTNKSSHRAKSLRMLITDPSKEELESFRTLQEKFSKATILVYLDRSKRLYIQLDASTKQIIYAYLEKDGDIFKEILGSPNDEEEEEGLGRSDQTRKNLGSRHRLNAFSFTFMAISKSGWRYMRDGAMRTSNTLQYPDRAAELAVF
jgi:hypothetical protein